MAASSSSSTGVDYFFQQLPLTEIEHTAASNDPSAVDTYLQRRTLTEIESSASNDISAVDSWPFWRKRNELHKAALRGEWEKAEVILNTLPGLGNLETDPQVLGVHYDIAVFSIGAGERAIGFVQQLVNYLPDPSLTHTNEGGISVLHVAAAMNNETAAILLVERNHTLRNAADRNGEYPAHRAAMFCNRKVLMYLMSVTDWEGGWMPTTRLQLFLYVIDARFVDIALDMVNKIPSIALTIDQQNRTALGHVVQRLWVSGSLTEASRIKTRQEFVLLARRLCKALECLSGEEPRDIYADAILKAASLKNHQVVETILETFPRAIACTEPTTGLTILHWAIRNRRRGVFRLIYQTGAYRHVDSEIRDARGNNILHMAATLRHGYADVHNPVIRMQLEIQWYWAVLTIVSKRLQSERNVDNMTPGLVFKEEHRKLKEDAIKWLKDMSNAYSIVAVLIITVMFAAAITVPGGNNNNSGQPMFEMVRAFKVFVFADAVSLFTSSVALLIFLSMLNSSVAQKSFLTFHTTQVALGLGFLYISIISMMVTFTAAVYLVLSKKTRWFLIPACVLAWSATVMAVLPKFFNVRTYFALSDFHGRFFGQKKGSTGPLFGLPNHRRCEY